MDMHGVFSHCMSNMGYMYLVHLGWTRARSCPRITHSHVPWLGYDIDKVTARRRGDNLACVNISLEVLVNGQAWSLYRFSVVSSY
jgi:hypothetical protein